jgi:hypothetical protein
MLTSLVHIGWKYYGYVIVGMLAFGGFLIYGALHTWFLESNMNGGLFVLGITAFHYFVWIRSLITFTRAQTKQQEQIEKLR